MEISLKNMEGNHLYKLNCDMKSSNIIGLFGDGKTEFISLLKNLSFTKGIISINNERLLKKDYALFNRNIKMLEKNFLFGIVEEELRFVIQKENIKVKDVDYKISSSLKLVGLDDSYLKRSIYSLSLTEQKLISLAKVIMGEFKILIIDELFEILDRKGKQKVYRLLLKLKEKKDCLILIGSISSDIIYQYTDQLMIFDNKEVLLETDTKNITAHIELLMKHKIEIPEIIMFTYKAKQQGIRLDYHKDIRDLMKDVYKHV